MDQPVRNLQEETSQYSPSMNWDRIHVSLHLIKVGWGADSSEKGKILRLLLLIVNHVCLVYNLTT